MPVRLSSEGLLRDYVLPVYRYFPTELLPNGTRDWARVRLLQTCERLSIPMDRWPKFDDTLDLPPHLGDFGFKFMPFQPPAFNELRDSPSEWRSRTEERFRAYCDERIRMIEERLTKLVKEGVLTRIPQPRDSAEVVAMRYEWAARRYCYNEQYKDMASAAHSPAAIRKHVSLILRTAEVSKRKLRG